VAIFIQKAPTACNFDWSYALHHYRINRMSKANSVIK
jgi:hypothetical protein